MRRQPWRLHAVTPMPAEKPDELAEAQQGFSDLMLRWLAEGDMHETATGDHEGSASARQDGSSLRLTRFLGRTPESRRHRVLLASAALVSMGVILTARRYADHADRSNDNTAVALHRPENQELRSQSRDPHGERRGPRASGGPRRGVARVSWAIPSGCRPLGRSTAGTEIWCSCREDPPAHRAGVTVRADPRPRRWRHRQSRRCRSKLKRAPPFEACPLLPSQGGGHPGGA